MSLWYYMWIIIELAYTAQCSDFDAISSRTSYYHISKEISHYPDYTTSWSDIKFDPSPFTDTQQHLNVEYATGKDELLIFY